MITSPIGWAVGLLLMTVGLGVAGRLGIIDTSAKLYSILLGVSGGLWGTILALLLFIGKTQPGSLWERVARVAALCAVAFFLYFMVVPDYIITQWGPVPDRIASWAIAGLVSVATFVLVLMGFTLSRLLGK